MATAASRRGPRAAAIAAATVLATVVIGSLLLASGSSRPRAAAHGTRTVAVRLPEGFGWLHPRAAPAGWRVASAKADGATLVYPPGWALVPGDRGTVSAALRDGSGRYAGYLNATPRQGEERLHDWARFRIDHNREEGVMNVRQAAAAEGLRFRNGRGSCVIDNYLSRAQSHAYREIACIVAGPRHAEVFVGAALVSDWSDLGTTLERAASAFVTH